MSLLAAVKRFGRKLVPLIVLASVALNVHGNNSLPEPEGPHKVGFRDFEFVDHKREEGFKPGTNRRLMARIWYPAESVSGAPRPYFTPQEFEVFDSPEISVLPPNAEKNHYRKSLATNSYHKAPLVNNAEKLPLLVFSHGGWGYVGSNVVLMEHLASYGYVVASVAHPYISNTFYPNGDVISPPIELLEEYQVAGRSPSLAVTFMDPDPEIRYKAQLDNNANFMLSPHFIVWRDDMITAVDALQHGNYPAHIKPIAEKLDFSKLGYFGMSFGAAGVNAAHIDPRAKAAVNLDGGNWDNSLVDAELRMPALIMHADSMEMFRMIGLNKKAYPHSQFSYERFATMGTRKDIVRLEVKGSHHMDFTDNALLPPSIRGQDYKVGFAGPIDGIRITSLVNEYTRAFFDYHVLGNHEAFPSGLYNKYPEVERIDFSEIREWAKSRRTRQ